MNIQDWFPLGLTGLISLLFKGLSRVFSNTTFLSISCLTTSNLSSYIDLIFQVSMQHVFTASDFTFTTKHIHYWTLFLFWPSYFIRSGAICNCPLLFPHSILDTLTCSGSSSGNISFCLFVLYMGSPGKNIGVGCLFLLQWTTFYQNSSLHPICLGWPCMASLIASLSYASPFSMTRLWSTKGKQLFIEHQSCTRCQHVCGGINDVKRNYLSLKELSTKREGRTSKTNKEVNKCLYVSTFITQRNLRN